MRMYKYIYKYSAFGKIRDKKRNGGNNYAL